MRVITWVLGLILCSVSLYAQGFDAARVGKALPGLDYVVLLGQNGRIRSYSNGVDAEESFLPCSTFKLAHALIALECGVITLENNRQHCEPKECHTDHGDPDLASAIQKSCISYFRQIARKIGKERMEGYLAKLGYPRTRIHWSIDGFWLDGGDFCITAKEQLAWIHRFYSEKLPVQARYLSAVRTMSLCCSTPKYVLYGKTGASKAGYGWFVGRVLEPQGEPIDIVFFIRGKDASGSKAQRVLEELLSAN